MKTIKQIAAELGVSKQAVAKAIAKLGIANQLAKNANRLMIDETQEGLILQVFSKQGQSINANRNANQLAFGWRFMEQEIEFLRSQLVVKDGQLEAAQEALKAEQVLHADTKKALLLAAVPPMGFLGRLRFVFGRKM